MLVEGEQRHSRQHRRKYGVIIAGRKAIRELIVRSAVYVQRTEHTSLSQWVFIGVGLWKVGRYTDDIHLDTGCARTMVRIKELSSTKNCSNYSVVVRIVITSSLPSESKHVPLVLGRDRVKNK